MKIALISHTFPPYSFGGVSTFSYDLAYALSKRKVYTIVFSGGSNKKTIKKMNSHLRVIRLPCFDFPPRHLWFQLQNFKAILNLVRDCDVLHCINPQISMVCIYIKRRLKKPLITSFHGLPIKELKNFTRASLSHWSFGDFGYSILEYPLNEFLTRIALTNSDYVTLCSHTTYKALTRLYKDLKIKDASIIYNGIDFNEIDRKINSIATIKKSHLTLIYYGRLFWLKGILHLIRAFKILTKDFPKLKLKIFGEGPLKNRVKMLISELNLKERVKVYGMIPRTEILKEIMKSDVVVLPSLQEAQPIAVLEAMALKKPVVVFDLPFAQEYLKDQYNGLFAKAGDPFDLADKIRILLLNKELRFRIGKNAYEYTKKNHNWSVQVDKYIEVYKSLSQLT